MRFQSVMLLGVGLLAGCGGSGGLGGGALSQTECQQLMDKIDEVMFAGLSDEERAEIEAEGESAADADSVDSCVAGETWDRAGHECAMKATTEGELDRCILKM